MQFPFLWQRVVAVCISRPAIQGNASKKKTTGRLPRPLLVVPSLLQLQQRGLAKTKSFDACEPQKPVAARPFAFVPDNSMRLLHGKGSRQSAFLLFIWQKKLIGSDTKADSTSGCFAMPRPLPAVSSFVQLRQRGLAKTNPGRSQHALFRASCVTRCAVTARPFAFVPDKRVRLLQGKGSRQSACKNLFS